MIDQYTFARKNGRHIETKTRGYYEHGEVAGFVEIAAKQSGGVYNETGRRMVRTL
jgi:hypothetical protein